MKQASQTKSPSRSTRSDNSRRTGGPRLRVVANNTAKKSSLSNDAKRAIDAAGRKDARRLLLLMTALVAFGLVIVLSASSVISIADYGSPWSLFERQVMWTALGAIAFFVLVRTPVTRLRRLALPAVFLAGFLLVVVLAPGIGKIAGGSSRWIGAGPIRIQPSEIAKLCFALFCADLVARREQARDQWHSIVRPVGLVLGVLAILIIKQPDLGTAIVLMCIASAVMFAGGVRVKLLGGVVAAIFTVGSIISLAAPYRRARLLSFINPFAHASTSGYQVVQSLTALGSGHLTGTGLGGSSAKWGLLPNAQTDFIFAVIGNELGVIGALGVLGCFALFGWLGIRVAARAQDRFASLLATAITCWLVCQAFINIGGVVGILPETGIPLPFLSFGGSSLVVALGAIGILVNIARHPVTAGVLLERPARVSKTPASARAKRSSRVVPSTGPRVFAGAFARASR